MTKLVAYAIAAAAIAAIPSIGSATTIYSQTNLADQTNTPVSMDFTALSGSTTISFEGYNVPSFINLSDIELTLTSDTTNLLGQTFSFTPASGDCSDASQSGPGSFGTNNLSFGSVCIGAFDTFSQSISTTAGDSYTLSFNLSNSDTPNALLINTSDAAVPEPATWAMMLVGFAGMAFALRTKRAKQLARAPA